MSQPELPLPGPCKRAEELLQAALGRRSGELRDLLHVCESPVEEILLVAMWDSWGCEVRPDGLGLEAYLHTERGVERLSIEPQREIPTTVARFRADFFVYTTPFGGDPRERASPLIVEVDGHEWHERTREQAARDKQRDRALLLAGFRVVRFTGGEVYHRPDACTEELRRLLE